MTESVVEPEHRSVPGSAAELFRTHRVPMAKLAFVLTGDSAVADEIVQDAFLHLHAHWGHVDNPVGYVRRSVVNGCHSYHRRRLLEERHAVASAESFSDVPFEIGDALAKLPQRQRTALTLRYLGDLSDADIASALDARPSTVRSLIRRGLGALRKELES
jgi:RNA polymerase sigma factor (sigma-70 family)